MHPAFPIALVFIGCCSNVVFLELLVREVPSSGNFVTFMQFFFIALEGFVFSTNFGTKQNVIPIKHYLLMVSMYFITSVVNNYAFNFNIAMPLHMIFRAGSLMANLVLGVLILRKRYIWHKYLSVVMITAGIAVATVASASQNSGHKTADSSDIDNTFVDFMWWCVGIALLTFALFMSARMGIYQEQTYAKFGKHPTEALFYNHALPLPFFLLLSSDIYRHTVIFSASEAFLIPVIGSVPRLWIYMLGNVLTQYVCIRGVFILTTISSSLTVTLVVTLRKFVSLLFSIMYFQNPFTLSHWFGTSLVFLGTLIFTEVISSIHTAVVGKTKKVE